MKSHWFYVFSKFTYKSCNCIKIVNSVKAISFNQDGNPSRFVCRESFFSPNAKDSFMRETPLLVSIKLGNERCMNSYYTHTDTHTTPHMLLFPPTGKTNLVYIWCLIQMSLEGVNDDVSTNCWSSCRKSLTQIAHYTFIDMKQDCLLNADINIMGNNGDGTW